MVTKKLNDLNAKVGHTFGLIPGDKLLVIFRLAPTQFGRGVANLVRNTSESNPGWQLGAFPRALVVDANDQIGDVIDLAKPSEQERRLLRVAFGHESKFENIKDLKTPAFTQQLAGARERLNRAFASLLPSSLPLTFTFEGAEGRREALSLFVSDQFHGHTPLSARGAGVRRILNTMVSILGPAYRDEVSMLLIDEPENSLHADAQHVFRGFLESLADSGRMQVVYATHSPAMINTFRPESVRVICRDRINDRAVSTINNRAASEDWFAVRTLLGISPADSLLYAPITIVIEGESEAIAVPLALRKLHKAGVAGFEEVPKIFSATHFVDGMGDNFEHWVRLAKSQGAKPIIFVDGDKIRRVNQADVRGRHSEVPIVSLPPGTEFEQIVPEVTYFAAIGAEHGIDATIDLLDSFTRWKAAAMPNPNIMFSKLVDRWLSESFQNVVYSKPAVVKRAIEMANPQEIRAEELRQLTIHVKTLMQIP